MSCPSTPVPRFWLRTHLSEIAYIHWNANNHVQIIVLLLDAISSLIVESCILCWLCRQWAKVQHSFALEKLYRVKYGIKQENWRERGDTIIWSGLERHLLQFSISQRLYLGALFPWCRLPRFRGCCTLIFLKWWPLGRVWERFGRERTRAQALNCRRIWKKRL